MKKFLPVLSAFVLAVPMMAQAATTILFDADGTGSIYSPVPIDSIDEKPGNALSIGGSGATLAKGDSLQLLYQANVFGTTLNGNTATVSCGFTVGSFSFPAACLTVVAGFPETVTARTGTSVLTDPTQVSFALTPGAGAISAPNATNFFYIYANAVDGDNLAGTGFTTGTRILSGFISNVFSSNFSTNGGVERFDQFGGDNYAGKQTLVGGGATSLSVKVTSVDPAFFPNFGASNIAFSFFNTSQVTPFREVDPSMMFSLDGMANGGTTPVLGSINGVTGRDFQLQADGNQSFVSIPEPGTITLVGMMLAGLGFMKRRRG